MEELLYQNTGNERKIRIILQKCQPKRIKKARSHPRLNKFPHLNLKTQTSTLFGWAVF
jgi:hypothetical protein